MNLNKENHGFDAPNFDHLRLPDRVYPVPMPDSAKPNTVLIFAPETYPSEAAQCADALASTLNERRGKAVMEGEIQAVLINSVNKANPYANKVVGEYRRTRT